MRGEAITQALLLGLILTGPTVWVWRHPLPATIGLGVYLTLEELFLLFVPAPLYGLARAGPEVLLYVAATSAVVQHLRFAHRPFRPRWPEAALVAVAVYGVVVAVWRGVPLVFTAIGIRWLFRYLAVYLIWRLQGTPAARVRLGRTLVLLLLLQSSIALAQAALQGAGIPVLSWMQATTGSADIGGVEVATGGTHQVLWRPFFVFGTLGRYNRFGILVATIGILALLAVAYGVPRERLARIGLPVSALALLLSTSRQGVMLVLLAVVVAAVWRLELPERVVRLLRGVTLLLFGSVVGVLGTGVLLVLRGESALLTRLLDIRTVGFRAYYLLVIVPKALLGSHFSGFGAGTFASRPHVMAHPQWYLQWGFPGQWALQYSYDSEWAVLLGQYGVIGLVLFYGALMGLGYRVLRALPNTPVRSWERVLSAAAVCYAAAFPVLGAVGAELGSRTTSFFFWVVMGAAVSSGDSPAFPARASSAGAAAEHTQ